MEPTSAPAQIVADTIVRTVELEVAITDAAVAGETTVVFCELVTDRPGRCPDCRSVGVYRDTMERRVTDLPVVGHPLRLRVRLPRYCCPDAGCRRVVFCHDSDRLARPRAKTTRRCARFVLRRLMIDKATVSAVARELGLAWDTVNGLALQATRTIVAGDTGRFDQVRVIGVDEHRWAHTHHADGQGYVTVITDLTDVVAGRGPARLLDLVPGRSAAVFADWLEERSAAFRAAVEVVAMDGFTGYKNAATSQVPDAVTVMSGSPGASLRRGPLRTVHATRRGTRLKQATRASRA